MKDGFKIPKVALEQGSVMKKKLFAMAVIIGGQWKNMTTDDYFKGKRVVLFSLLSAFTPTCSSQQLLDLKKNTIRLNYWR